MISDLSFRLRIRLFRYFSDVYHRQFTGVFIRGLNVVRIYQTSVLENTAIMSASFMRWSGNQVLIHGNNVVIMKQFRVGTVVLHMCKFNFYL